ncbi:MAG TPA: rhodanese-like domain-containing protein [Dermatophilaceae bacterium]|nr:rhodanese-like domain-containing protein [Dermatophilaceae bacterium]
MTHPDQFGVPSADIREIDDDAVMVDVREPHEFAAGHAPGAILIPLGDLPHRLDDLPDTDDSPVAITCRSGNRSGRAVAWLTQQGFDVVNMDGGMLAWQAAGKPVVASSGTSGDGHII